MSGYQGSERPINEKISELRSKIQLLDGDRKAYYENSEWTIKKHREQICKMRRENGDLFRKRAERLAADESVVCKGLEEHEKERTALRNKPGKEAIHQMDAKVRDKVNILNNARYQTSILQKKLESLQTQYSQMVKDASDAAATDAGESEDAQTLRNLENRLDKAHLKLREAEHIRKTYQAIKVKLEDEHQCFENILDEMEQERKKLAHEQKELRAMNNDAQIARDAAKAELEKQEREVYADRRRRELELAKVRKEAEEKKLHQERVERRLARTGSIQQDELTSQERAALGAEEDQQKISTFEEAFRRIKEATGVSDTQEVVTRFENQGETQAHLEDLKKEGEKQIIRLKEEKDKLQEEFEEMKYSGEAKLSSGQRLLEEFETQLDAEEKRRDEALDRLDRSSKILTSVKSGVEHLAEKLKHLKPPSSQVQKAKISPSSNEYLLDLLSTCEEKLLKVLELLDQNGKDLNEVLKQMEEDEYQNTAELKLPQYNTRVKLPQTQRDNVYDDEDDSGEDEDVLTRNNIKRQSQNIVDSKTKRRMGRKKKKAK